MALSLVANFCIVNSNLLSLPIVVVPYTHAYFGEGTSNISLGGLACSGREERLVDCGHAQPVCTHAEDAGVRCGGKKEMHLYLQVSSEQCDSICLSVM